MASLWPGSGSAGRRSKNVSEELRKVVICRTFGLWSVWAQGRGCSPHWWGRRKTAGAREGRPFWLPVFRAAICASQSLLLRKRKGAAGPVGPTSGSESGPGALLSGPVVGVATGKGLAAAFWWRRGCLSGPLCAAFWEACSGAALGGLVGWERYDTGRFRDMENGVLEETRSTRHKTRHTRYKTRDLRLEVQDARHQPHQILKC